MPSTLHPRGTSLVRHGEVTAPNWALVPFEVGCARCGHDLRGLTEPKCPSCALEFEWSQAVPIEQLVCCKCSYHLYGLTETRCPECGEPFTWAEVLDDYRRKRKPLFEYRWRDRPFRSLVYTWWLALRPWKLWRTVDVHDPPRVGPLSVWVAFSLVLLLVSWGIGLGLSLWCWNNYVWVRVPARGWTGPALGEIPGYLSRAVQDVGRYPPFWFFLLWVLLSLPALLIFQQSMRRCRVKTPHVVRTWAYAVPTWFPVVTALMFGLSCVQAISQSHRTELANVLIATILIPVVWSLTYAYSRYLKIPHPLGVAIAAQIVAVLAALEALTVIRAAFGIWD